MTRTFFCAVLIATLPLASLFAAEPVKSQIGEVLHVFPGDKFYLEGQRVDRLVLELSEMFESRMPGAMRIPSSFAIDSRRLRWSHDRDGWSYFVAPPGKGRAWHGLLGNVMARGDTVGMRIRSEDGKREWFVDNSIHNRMNTIWSRKLDPKKDVTVTEGSEQAFAEGDLIQDLEYLGVRDGQLRIRYTETATSLRQDEFFFPISAQMPMLIGIKGLRAEVLSVDGASARIKVLQGFDHDQFADPASAINQANAPSDEK